MPTSFRKCTCGSGEYGQEQFDARGIYLCLTCDGCHENKMSKYRPEVLTNSNYSCCEDIGEDYYAE